MNLADWHHAGHYIDFNGHKIYTQALGTNGPTVLVLHGFPTASYDYARIAPLLTPHFRLILFDFLGYGFSDKPQRHPYSLLEQADVTEAVAKHYGLEQVYVLTHDIGNSVVLEVMKRGQLKLERVVMLNGSVLMTHYRPVITQKLLLHPTIGPLMTRLRLIRRPMFARQFGKLFAQRPTADEIGEFWDLIQYNDGVANYHLLIQYLSERRTHELTWLEALAQHTAPLTVIWGQRDPIAVPKIAEAILERRPDTHYFPLDEIGHFPQWEAPELVAQIIVKAFS